MALEIIGVSGKAGSGKDFLARTVLRPLGYQSVAFAWPLKMTGITQGIGTYADMFQTKPPHVREWLQNFGTRARRIDAAYWVKQLDALLTVLHREGGIDKFVITDMRYPNEFAYVRQLGGKTIRLSHGDRPYPLAGTDAADHSSETALDDEARFDLMIENDRNCTKARMELALYAAGIIPDRPQVPAPVRDFVREVLGNPEE